jgi:hypothetical protein
MTGVLVHDTQRPFDPLRPRPRHLGDVAHARTEFAPALSPGPVLVEHVAIRLEMRAASGRIDHDGKIVAGERIDVESRELACLLAVSRMRVQCSATHLLDRRRDAPSVALENPHRRALRLAEGLAHDAASEQRQVRVGTFRQREGRSLRPRRQPAEPSDPTGADAPRQ